MLCVSKMDAFYGESRVIRGLDLEVPDGKIAALIGRNGMGKSTTLKSIMGLVKTPCGSIRINGEEIIKKPAYDRARLGIGYVPQGRDIFPQMTVAENLELGLLPLGKKGRVPEYIYEMFPILERFSARKGGDLSGGQQQQLAIGRALAANPKILILDEPTEGIQPSIIKEIGKAVRQINKTKGIAVLIVEQYLDFVFEIADYVYVMEKGEIIFKDWIKDADKEQIQRLMTE